MKRLPSAYLEKMKSQLGDEYEEYAQSLACPVSNALRINTAKILPEEYEKIAPWNLKKVPWIRNGYYYEDVCNPAKHPHYYAGVYYLQEPSAMTPASRLPVCPGERVLDLCAAPGGKATELGARLMGKGFLLANDISSSRARALLKNLELLGISNIFVTSEEPEKLCGCYGEYFDKILLDAPCSGEGMFRKDPKMAAHWEERGPGWYAPIQEKLADQAYRMLRPGGMMLYATCTFSAEENELVILRLTQDHPDLEIVPVEPGYKGFAPGIPQKGREDLKNCVHIYPHRIEGEGHFLALLKKAGRAAKRQPEASEKLRLSADAEEFLRQVSLDFSDGYFYQRKNQVYFLNNSMAVKKGLRYLRTGLWVGTVAKKRFEPSQVLAMALKKEQFDSVVDFPASDERVRRYLKGETLDIPDCETGRSTGWQLVCVDGYPLGFGKKNGRMLKNKYYAGWRWL